MPAPPAPPEHHRGIWNHAIQLTLFDIIFPGHNVYSDAANHLPENLVGPISDTCPPTKALTTVATQTIAETNIVEKLVDTNSGEIGACCRCLGGIISGGRICCQSSS